ncbi:UDP-N-acetylglucosamine 1-carboxyvinyltransferase [Candidatus Gottesmanbacteria bacterium]|nr:UDP-N-acetylglucosamine 1-carboxyvinyltransferase [Candidatus Gottesmanbacteria bacterium]
MYKFVIAGGKPLRGRIKVGGAKNVAMKIPVAALLTDDKLKISGMPQISSVTGTLDIVHLLGVKSKFTNHTLEIESQGINKYKVPLDTGSHHRTSTMVVGPLLARFGRAIVPNPGGCRIGLRPINLHVSALTKMGAKVKYNSKDGYYYLEARKSLEGISYTFPKNSHTGTETIILAAVLANGTTIIDNAAEEPEVDDLIKLLTLMGANIQRVKRKIIIKGVKKLHGTDFTIMPDRNETVTFAIAALATNGDVIVEGTDRHYIKSFLNKLNDINAGWEPIGNLETRFYGTDKILNATTVETAPYPGFMTDWQAPWTVLMTQCSGGSSVHETVFEDRFSYVSELIKTGAKIDFFNPKLENPDKIYNFDLKGKKPHNQAISITGPTPLHDAILETADLRAGATLVIAGLVATGTTHVHGVEHIDRGYERLDERLKTLGGRIKRIKE